MDDIKYNPIQTSSVSTSAKLRNMLWRLVNVTLFRITPSYFSFFRKTRVALLRLWGAQVAWDASIHPSVNIDFPWNISIGNLSSLGKKSWIYALDKVVISNKCCIGQDVYLLTGSHDVSSSTFDLVTNSVIIKNNVWVATGSYILPGVCLSDNTVVAAGSVVCKSTDTNDIVGGNPAKFIKKRIIKG